MSSGDSSYDDLMNHEPNPATSKDQTGLLQDGKSTSVVNVDTKDKTTSDTSAVLSVPHGSKKNEKSIGVLGSFLCALKYLSVILTYLTFILLLIIIFNSLLGDLLYDTDEMLDGCKRYLGGKNEKLKESNSDIIAKLIQMQQKIGLMYNNNQYIDETGATKTLDISDPKSLELIINLKNSFDELIYKLNVENRDTDSQDILKQLDHANLQISEQFNNTFVALEKKVLDTIKEKNMSTTSRFTNMVSDFDGDISYGMAASGITKSDLKTQRQYLDNPDNLTAFSSVLQKTEISLLGDGAETSTSVKPWGFRQPQNYVSPYSGPGFGATTISENVSTDASKIKTISFRL